MGIDILKILRIHVKANNKNYPFMLNMKNPMTYIAMLLFTIISFVWGAFESATDFIMESIESQKQASKRNN